MNTQSEFLHQLAKKNANEAISRLNKSKTNIPIMPFPTKSVIVDEAVFIVTNPSQQEKKDIYLLALYLHTYPDGDLANEIWSTINISKAYFPSPLRKC